MNEAERKELRKRSSHKAEWWLFAACLIICMVIIGIIVYYGLIAGDDPDAVGKIARLLNTDVSSVEPWIELRGVFAVVVLLFLAWDTFLGTMLDIGKAFRREMPVTA